jgi:TetR/AcrR family transcriptional repressor of nem operon
MGRPKAFDRDQALEKAMHLFWTKGYEATSVDDLLGAMEIGRQSLYDTFGDKRALFLAALERYQGLLDDFLRSCLADTTSVKAALRRLFDDTIAEPHERKRRGCLMVNTAVELAPHDPEAARRVADSQRASERLFVRALELARDRGELAAETDVRPLARFLMTVLQGLRVAAKADPSPARLRDIADVALRALD